MLKAYANVRMLSCPCILVFIFRAMNKKQFGAKVNIEIVVKTGRGWEGPAAPSEMSGGGSPDSNFQFAVGPVCRKTGQPGSALAIHVVEGHFLLEMVRINILNRTRTSSWMLLTRSSLMVFDLFGKGPSWQSQKGLAWFLGVVAGQLWQQLIFGRGLRQGWRNRGGPGGTGPPRTA